MDPAVDAQTATRFEKFEATRRSRLEMLRKDAVKKEFATMQKHPDNNQGEAAKIDPAHKDYLGGGGSPMARSERKARKAMVPQQVLPLPGQTAVPHFMHALQRTVTDSRPERSPVVRDRFGSKLARAWQCTESITSPTSSSKPSDVQQQFKTLKQKLRLLIDAGDHPLAVDELESEIDSLRPLLREELVTAAGKRFVATSPERKTGHLQRSRDEESHDELISRRLAEAVLSDMEKRRGEDSRKHNPWESEGCDYGRLSGVRFWVDQLLPFLRRAMCTDWSGATVELDAVGLGEGASTLIQQMNQLAKPGATLPVTDFQHLRDASDRKRQWEGAPGVANGSDCMIVASAEQPCRTGTLLGTVRGATAEVQLENEALSEWTCEVHQTSGGAMSYMESASRLIQGCAEGEHCHLIEAAVQRDLASAVRAAFSTAVAILDNEDNAKLDLNDLDTRQKRSKYRRRPNTSTPGFKLTSIPFANSLVGVSGLAVDFDKYNDSIVLHADVRVIGGVRHPRPSTLGAWLDTNECASFLLGCVEGCPLDNLRAALAPLLFSAHLEVAGFSVPPGSVGLLRQGLQLAGLQRLKGELADSIDLSQSEQTPAVQQMLNIACHPSDSWISMAEVGVALASVARRSGEETGRAIEVKEELLRSPHAKTVPVFERLQTRGLLSSRQTHLARQKQSALPSFAEWLKQKASVSHPGGGTATEANLQAYEEEVGKKAVVRDPKIDSKGQHLGVATSGKASAPGWEVQGRQFTESKLVVADWGLQQRSQRDRSPVSKVSKGSRSRSTGTSPRK